MRSLFFMGPGINQISDGGRSLVTGGVAVRPGRYADMGDMCEEIRVRVRVSHMSIGLQASLQLCVG